MRQTNTSSTRSATIPAAYLGGLQPYWSGRPMTAIEYLSKILAGEPEHPQRFQLYRLWIEALSDLGEQAALHSLKEHLLQRGLADDANSSRWAALRGIIHLELDEAEATHLLARALRRETSDPYVLEFRQRAEQRAQSKGKPRLWQHRAKLNDYFHVQSLARHALASHSPRQLDEIMNLAAKRFPNSPLPLVYELHQSIDAGDFEHSGMIAADLAARFPGHPDYDFFAAYASVRRGDFDSAQKRLAKAMAVAGEQDPDIVWLMGMVHDELSKRRSDKHDDEKAGHFLRRASSILKNHGYPTHMPEQRLSSRKAEESDETAEVESIRGGHAWLIKLSQRRYHELRTSPESTINELVRPMGAEARPGDLVFFAAEAPRGYAHATRPGELAWNIAAIYSVSTDPMWDPLWRYQNSLQLVHRPSAPIPVDVNFVDESASEGEVPDRNHPWHYGVFGLEGGALDIIMAAVRKNRFGENRNDETLLERLKMPRSS